MMTIAIGSGRKTALGLGLAALFAPGMSGAQIPSETAEIGTCLCMQQATATLSADMNARNQALDSVNRQLADLDAQLARERSTVNVNNPDAVARFKALLEHRDATYRQSIGPVHEDAVRATARYNEQVSQYNARCANRPFNSALVAEVQVHLMCPPLR